MPDVAADGRAGRGRGAFDTIGRRLGERRVAAAVTAVLLVVAAANLYFFRHDFAALAAPVLPSALPTAEADAGRWQSWARHHDRLFAMLAAGERVGVQIEGQRSSGVVIERTANGLLARRAVFLRRADPGVILVMGRDTAEELLAAVPSGDPEDVWQAMKDRLYGRQITIWNDSDVDRLDRGGYLAFLRAIDTRPADHDWAAIKARLGEE